MFRYCTNLVNESSIEGHPWDFVPQRPFPDLAGLTPKERKDSKIEILRQKDFDWNCFTANTGLNANLRIGKTNPVRWVHGMVVDLDANLSEDELASFIGSFRDESRPSYAGRSLGGNWHLAWEFKVAVKISNPDVYPGFLEQLRDKMGLKGIISSDIGVDMGAFADASRLYTNGAAWFKLGEQPPIEPGLLQGALMESYSKLTTAATSYTSSMTLDQIYVKLAERYPTLDNLWPGGRDNFVEGAQGPSFWDPNSKSPSSAIVKAEGMVSFSDNVTAKRGAEKGVAFVPWGDEDLLGSEFIREMTVERDSLLTDCYWLDAPKVYYHPDNSGVLMSATRENMTDYLRDLGFAAKVAKGQGLSEVSSKLLYIRKEQRLKDAIPFLWNRNKVVIVGSQPYLNINEVFPIEAAPDVVLWDDPRIATIRASLINLLGNKEINLPLWLSWSARIFQRASSGNPMGRSQALFIFGGVGTGKTMVTDAIIGRMLGGTVDAAAYFVGKSDFGEEIFRSGLPTVHDIANMLELRNHVTFSDKIKCYVANTGQSIHGKYKTPVTIEHSGGVVVTGNLDSSSVACIPDITNSSSDKVIVIGSEKKTENPFSFQHLAENLPKELPYFAAFLRDYVTPPELQSGSRFGLIPYQDQELMNKAQQGRADHVLACHLAEVAESMFNDPNFTDEDIKMSPNELHRTLSSRSTGQFAREFTIRKMTICLENLLSQPEDTNRFISKDDSSLVPIWIIHREKLNAILSKRKPDKPQPHPR